MRRWMVGGPLMSYIKSYMAFLNDAGYSHGQFLAKTRLIIRFSRWLNRKRVGIRDLTLRHAKAFWRTYSSAKRGDPKTLKDFMECLRRKGVISGSALNVHKGSPVGVDLLIEKYSSYLAQERGLAARSIDSYTCAARTLLAETCPHGRSQLKSLSAEKISDFFLHHVKNHRSSKSMKLLTVAVRSFLRFARQEGYIAKALADSVPSAAGWSMTSIPRALPQQSVRRVLAQSKRQLTPCGLRDRAVLMLLARLGLRAQEVALLELDDIDWSNSCIYVRGKERQETSFPLQKDVGEAIAMYLRAGRPESLCRRVFLRAHAPFQGLATSAAVSQIARRALQRARIKSLSYGAHQFRHSLATNMLHKGASLTEIGQVLRHKSPDTTMLYAKVDLDSLRKIALPWPGRPR